MWLSKVSRILILFVLLKVALVTAQTSTISCNYERDENQNSRYTCNLLINNPSGGSFDTIPGHHLDGQDNENVRAVVAQFQNTKNIPSVICRQFPILNILVLQACQISEFNEDSLIGCGELTFLNLVYNDIPAIPDNSFQRAPRISIALFGRNKIATIGNSAFPSRMVSLDLSLNEITEFPQAAISAISELIVLNMISNKMTSLPDNAFSQNAKLSKLILSGNPLTNVPNDAFRGLNELRILELMNCGLNEVRVEWFRDLDNLFMIHLESNAISSLPDQVFAISRKLISVFLSGNNLTQISAAAFGNNLPALEILDLAGNQIRGIERSFFDTASNLQILQLGENICSNENFLIDLNNRDHVRSRLERCSRGFGADLISCEYENINVEENEVYACHMTVRNPQGNTFTEITGNDLEGRNNSDIRTVDIIDGNTRNFPTVICTTFTGLQNLIVHMSFLEEITQDGFSSCTGLINLHLSNNMIMEVPENVFSNSTNLKELYLGSNPIEIVHPNAFFDLKLEVLDLSNTFIKTINNAWFQPMRSSLKVLDLLFIQSTGLPADSFEGLGELTELYLNDNIMTTIDATIFSSLVKLENLGLSSASLTHLNPEWFKTLTNLQVLYIAQNELNDLPEGVFSTLTNLQQLHINANQLFSLTADHFGNNSLEKLELLYASNNLLNVIDGAILERATNLSRVMFDSNLCANFINLAINESSWLREEMSTCTANHQATRALSCNYQRAEVGRMYWCNLTAVNPGGFDDFEEITGDHESVADDGAVIYVHVEEQNTVVIPSIICSQFQSMVNLDIIKSNVGQIREATFRGCNYLRELTIMGNNIRSIPLQAFTGAAKSLQVLNLASNGINDVSPYAFAQTRLQTLDLSHNRIGIFDTYTYSQIGETLKNLILTDNLLTTLPPNAFDGLPNLDVLELNGNRFVTIPDHAFRGTVNIRQLQMAGCGIERINVGTFAGLTRLVDLELGDNQIGLLPESIFDLPSLKRLSVVQNQLRSLDAASFGRSLESLVFIDAGINRIDAIDPKILENNEVLDTLELFANTCVDSNFMSIPENRETVIGKLESCITNYNAVTPECSYGNITIFGLEYYGCLLSFNNTIDRLTFDTASGTHVDELITNDDVQVLSAIDQDSKSIPRFFCNFFSSIEFILFALGNLEIVSQESFANCSKLSTLVLSGNQISFLPDGLFNNTPDLKILQISGNRIQTLTPEVFRGVQLEGIDLSSNQLTTFNHEWFTDSQFSLLSLLLNNNQLTEFMRFTFPFTELISLGISNNPNVFIPSDAFRFLTHLNFLNVAKCGITNLNHRWFDDLTALVTLELDENNINRLPAEIFDLNALKFLGLSVNFIEALQLNAFGKHLSEMETIDVEYNHINAVERAFFDGATNLNTLEMIGNNCTDNNFVQIQENREEVISALEQCFNNFQSN